MAIGEMLIARRIRQTFCEAFFSPISVA